MSSLAQVTPIWCDYHSQYWLQELPILMVICLLSHIDIVGYGQVNTSIGEVRNRDIFVGLTYHSRNTSTIKNFHLQFCVPQVDIATTSILLRLGCSSILAHTI